MCKANDVEESSFPNSTRMRHARKNYAREQRHNFYVANATFAQYILPSLTLTNSTDARILRHVRCFSISFVLAPSKCISLT